MSDNAVIIGQASVGRDAAWTAARHGGRPDRSERLPARSAPDAARHKQLWSRGLGLRGRILLHLIYIETTGGIGMDQRWELMKMMSGDVAEVLEACGYDERAGRMRDCASVLKLQHCECGCQLVWRTNYCRDRVCPVCEWRKSIIMARRAAAAIDRAKSNSHDVVMLTLTVRNVEWSRLRETLMRMHKEFQALWRLLAKRHAMFGYIRRTEITVGRDGLAHPHMHVLIDRHSEGGYVKQKALCAAWKNAMKLDYDPVVDIRVCWEQNERKGLVRYVHKYCTKSSPAIILGLDAVDVMEYVEAVKGLRMVSSGGTLRMKDPSDASEDEMLAGIDDLVLQRKWCEHHGDFKVKCPRCGKMMQLDTAWWNGEARAYVTMWPIGSEGNGDTSGPSVSSPGGAT